MNILEPNLTKPVIFIINFYALLFLNRCQVKANNKHCQSFLQIKKNFAERKLMCRTPNIHGVIKDILFCNNLSILEIHYLYSYEGNIRRITID